MTNADDTLKPDDARVPERRDDPDAAPSNDSTPPKTPSRRNFLAALAGLGLVHFKMLRLGVPVPRTRPVDACGGIVGGQIVEDLGCGTQSPQGPSADGDCGLSTGGGPISQDGACGASTPGAQQHVTDGDCGIQGMNEVSQDNLCNGIRFYSTQYDHDCGVFPTGAGSAPSIDHDCNLASTFGYPSKDNNCGLQVLVPDHSCGKHGPLSGVWMDASCGLQWGPSGHMNDQDCGMYAGLGGYWPDDDCAKTSYISGDPMMDNTHV